MEETTAPATALTTNTLASVAGLHVPRPGLVDAINAWKEKRREEVHRKVAARSARVSREKYRAEREAEGKTVRPYEFHDHQPRRDDETESDYRKRIHRDRQQSYRGASDVKHPRADLSKMTPTERADHTRKLAAARKKRERDRKKGVIGGENLQGPTSAIDGIEQGVF